METNEIHSYYILAKISNDKIPKYVEATCMKFSPARVEGFDTIKHYIF